MMKVSTVATVCDGESVRIVEPQEGELSSGAR
jgi:hypothetical protein